MWGLPQPLSLNSMLRCGVRGAARVLGSCFFPQPFAPGSRLPVEGSRAIQYKHVYIIYIYIYIYVTHIYIYIYVRGSSVLNGALPMAP